MSQEFSSAPGFEHVDSTDDSGHSYEVVREPGCGYKDNKRELLGMSTVSLSESGVYNPVPELESKEMAPKGEKDPS